MPRRNHKLMSSWELEIHSKSLFPNPKMEGGDRPEPHGPLLNSGPCVKGDSKHALSPGGAEKCHGHLSLNMSTFLQNPCLSSLLLRWNADSLGLLPGGGEQSDPQNGAHKRKLNVSSHQATQLMSEG